MSGEGEADPWRMTEWEGLPEVCLIAACESSDIDQRGPVWLRNGSIRKACTAHWEGIFSVLGEQVTWRSNDGSGQVIAAAGS